MTRKCPKCGKEMIQLSFDHSLDEKWICANCGREESKHHFDDEVKEQTGQKPK